MSRAKLTPTVCWALWRDVLGQTEQFCLTLEESGGEEIAFPPEYRRAVCDLADVPFPVDGRSSEQMASAFRLQANALMTVLVPLRRVAIAGAVLGSVRGLLGLYHAEQARLTQVQLTRHGAGD